MVDVVPFRALHYDPAKVGGLANVIAPPYDVIDDAQLDQLYARSPHNVVRLILNRSADRYAAAASDLRAWRQDGVLVRDSEPCLYYYVQDFLLPDGRASQRAGLMAAVRLAQFTDGVIRPHERTFSGPKEDRIRLTQACKTNLSSIFGMYSGHAGDLSPARNLSETQPPWVDAPDDRGGRHRVWRISDLGIIERIRASFRDETVLIADGHHRYETALAYQAQRRAEGDSDTDAPHNFVLMYLTSMEEPGLLVFPTHRVWRGTGGDDERWSSLSESFEIEEFPATATGEGQLLQRLNAAEGIGVFGLRLGQPSRCCLLTLRDPALVERRLGDVHAAIRRLDVTILDSLVLHQILGFDGGNAKDGGELTFTHDEAEALAAGRSADGAAFLMRSPKMSEIESVCMSGEVMPQKSTYFYPKLESGLVFHPLSLDADD